MEIENIYDLDFIASKSVARGNSYPNHGKVYYKTNEDLVNTVLDVDFKDKEVLSVLSSGDHVLTARYLDAKRVDAFDINRLTPYYFYLRLWSINYRGELYPNIYHNKWMNDLLSQVKAKTLQEKMAVFYYKKHLANKTPLDKLFYDVESQPEGNTLYTKAEELKDVTSPVIDFWTADLFSEINIPRTYDIALTSNTFDWGRNDKDKLIKARNNLLKLLKDDGVCIASKLVNYSQSNEKDIFKEFFDIEETKGGVIYRKRK